MPAKSRLIPFAAGALLAVAIVSCDDSPNPTRPSTPPTANPPAGAATVTRVDTVIPATMAPGTSAQATATAAMSDGSVRDVTAEVQWTSTNTRAVQTSATGALVAAERGEAIVVARMGQRSSSGRIFVLPAGTFRLAGQISEAGVVLSGVRVEVIAGTGQGLTAFTNSSGQFALYGVAGRVSLHAKKDGYVNSTQDVEVTDHQTANFEMKFDGQRPQLEGTYTLEITAQGCGASIPEAVTRRSYVASITQAGGQLLVRLSGAEFIVTNGRGNGFGGFVQGDRVQFTLLTSASYFYYYYYFGQDDLVERLTPTSAVVIGGSMDGRVSGSNISGTLNGIIGVSNRVTSPFYPASSCYSQAHRFEMRRQS
jgi:hypothetical protein